MATTVEQLYTQILGRAPDPEGLAFWQSAFGSSVDPAEQASFMQAAQAELANRSAQEQVLLAPKIIDPTSTGVTNADILGWFNANPNASDALIAKTMQEAGVSPTRLAEVTGTPVAQIANLYQAAIAPTTVTPPAPTPESITAKLTQQILGQGTTDKWTGEGKGSPQANAADMANILAGIGITDVSQFGQIQKTVVDENGNESIVTTYGNKVTGQEVPNTYSERQSGNAFGGTFQGKGNTGYRVEFDAQGKPLFYTTGASSSDVPSWVKPALILGGAYLGLNATGLLGGGLTEAALTAGDLAIGGGGLAGYAPLTAAEIAGLTATDLAIGGTAGAAGLLPGAASLLAGGADVTTNTARELAAATAAASALPTTTTLSGAVVPAVVTSALTNAGVSTAVNSLLGGGTSNTGNLLNTGLTTAAGLLQQQTSREAALAAQQRIDAETAAAKQVAAFRPVGMTTRFGTSQFQVDPVTGQLTSAGYTLSPEAKAQQDRFMALSNAGLTQAEQAQAQFAPLQTGAQRLFGLGNQYLAQSPEAVAQNYLNQQMALLQPGRELELANLQNKLQQQGRGGLAVAQGGALGATTPELQALYNARATQEAQLAAQAQQAGQQQVTFGAGLLGQGTTAMGNYYAGQQAAYAPYTTAMGQVQGLEALGQQPFTMGAQLGQTASTAGARVGALGLEGANISQRLATGAAATTNPYSTAISGLSANPAFGQLLGGLFSNVPTTAMSAPATSFGTGSYYGNQDLGLYL